MNAADYDAWYDTPRGRWVGDAECRILLRAVEPRQGESLLDVGCGTGWFTRRMARLPGVQVTGLDINA
ncbi:SAM-dependent methyltransferase, partial [Propionivibrio sp.]|uniref:SAM-dependent methyltransferase n=1 Tax=Propionivibrio sp. TaxID=2212460 RepID=UPI00272EC288